MKSKKILNDLLHYETCVKKYRCELPEVYGKIGLLPDLLKVTKWKVSIYGAGHKGVAIFLWLLEHNVSVDFFIDRDTSSSNILGIPVYSISEAENLFKKRSYAVIVGVRTNDKELNEISSLLQSCNAKNVYFAKTENALRLDYWSKDILMNPAEMKFVFENLSDSESREMFVEFLRVHITRDFWRIKQYDFNEKYFCQALFDVNSIDTFICAGGYIGDTVVRFTLDNKKFKKIIVFEPDKHCVEDMQCNLSYLPKYYQEKIEIVDKKVGNDQDAERIDSIFSRMEDMGKILISADIEGGEIEMLKGARKLISAQKPILALSAYHKWDDFPAFIRTILSYNSRYKFYVRKYRGHHSAPAEEIVLYAIPT